jgi:hypothetical protein
MNANKRKAKIYKLYCDDGCYYYGSTIERLCKRMSNHKRDSQREDMKNNKVYSHILSIGWDRVKIILIEEFEYETRDDIRSKENKYIVDSLNDELCLNNNRSKITDEERLQKVKEYREAKAKVKNSLIKCECGMEHTIGRTQQHQNSVLHKTLLNKK